MWKTIAYILSGIVVLAFIVGFYGIRKFNKSWFKDRQLYTTFTVEEEPMDMVFNSDSMGSYLEPHGAVSISARLPELPMKWYFQFDTGSPYSMVYGNTLKSLETLGYEFEVIEKDGSRFVEKIDLKLGGVNATIEMIKVLEGYGNKISDVDTSRILKIGTIGSDLLEDRVTAIDFKNGKIRLYDSRPEWMLSLSNFRPFHFQGRRIMLPATIGSKKLELFYDSGCSPFGLLTSKYRFRKNTSRDSTALRLPGNSWGNSIPIVHKNTAKRIVIGGQTLPLRRISYIDMYANYQKFVSPFTRIGGFLGNKPFINSTVIFDTMNEEFAVLGNEEP